MLLPTSNSEILSNDEASVEVTDLDGRSISALMAEGPALEVSTRLQVKQTEDVSWPVSGVREGSDFEARLTGEPMSDFGTMLMARRAIAAPQQRSVTYTTWDDNAPGEFATAKFTLLDSGPPDRANFSMLGLDAETTLDEEGRVIAARMASEGIDVAIDQVFKEGSLPHVEPSPDAP